MKTVLEVGVVRTVLLILLPFAFACDAAPDQPAPAWALAKQAPRAQPLDAADFVVREINGGTSGDRARDLLGAPDSIIEHPHPHDAGSKLVRWDYADVRIHFWNPDEAAGVELTGPGAATHRGIRVGDPLQAVREKYGEPSRTSDEGWIYLDPADPSELHLLRFRADAGRVTNIFVGTVLD